ncbi:hypothetical protein OTSGILL_0077 [Orientia tsutsugamushi str. Gilliam]|uniref:IS5 family transposase ISOt6 n=1 Tax=Orientia tsutsugamushi str. Gilliam TaxID=1359184 RepID=A0A0F3MEI5_ORITS|nr:hypothetical protein OTSGILL_0077 [Orientia tsutsugamushi str. Gilliam]SPR02170.1 IS5 family transposase ISOt6 [Orientia tsutsugamushi str. Gilliam]
MVDKKMDQVICTDFSNGKKHDFLNQFRKRSNKEWIKKYMIPNPIQKCKRSCNMSLS